MSAAFMGQVLRVNLENGQISSEPIRDDWAKQFLGGAGLATRYLYAEVPPGADPLGPSNKLIFMTGPLTGTASASAGRYSVVAMSPLTGLWGQANSGGRFGPALKRSGYDGIIFEGVSPSPVYLKIVSGKAELCAADHLWGKTVGETESSLLADIDGKAVVASIGPAGENLVRYAAIMNNRHRAAGRCGLGAVMGAKRLKAVICAGNAPVRLADPNAFLEVSRKQIEFLNDSLLKVGFDAFGTNMVSDLVNVRGGYPTRNWQSGVFDQIESVNAQALIDKVFVEGVSCFACPVTCGRGSEIRSGKWQGQRGEGPEYETANMFGANCGIDDMEAITMANYRCNELGLDTISAGSTIAFAMECYQRGLLTPAQTGGLEVNFGDTDLVVDLVDKIAHRQGLGDLLAEGTRRMSESLGGDSASFAMHVKGLELPAYDPRAAKITGLGYVTANRGGDHITGYIQLPTFVDMPMLIVEESQIKDPFTANPEESKVLVDMEDALTVFDAIGGCKFMGILLTAEDIAALVAHATGWEFGVPEFRAAGERIYNLARLVCARQGLTRAWDALPPRLVSEPLTEGPAQGMLIDPDTLERLKDAYYAHRGWDIETGLPTPGKLHALGLGDLVPDLETLAPALSG